MDIDVFSSSELPTVFGVLRSALNAAGPLDARERDFIETFARIVGAAAPAQDPAPLAAEDVWLEGEHPRKRLLQLSALAVLLNRPLRPASVQFLRDLGRQLEVHDGVLDVVAALSRGQRRKVRLLAARRAFGGILGEAYRAEGVLGIARFMAALLFKRAVNRDRYWDYKRLGLLPDGTLGREYWRHMTSLGFGHPGEPGGIAHSGAFHDVGHVLTGYDTTPAGEILQGSFQGGSRRDDGFLFIQFVILQFHHGVTITPVAPGEFDLFEPRKVLWAIHRGASCKVDITHQWDFWPWMKLTVEEARARFGLLPA
jgi:hypothetical protein